MKLPFSFSPSKYTYMPVRVSMRLSSEGTSKFFQMIILIYLGGPVSPTRPKTQASPVTKPNLTAPGINQFSIDYKSIVTTSNATKGHIVKKYLNHSISTCHVSTMSIWQLLTQVFLVAFSLQEYMFAKQTYKFDPPLNALV